MVRRRRFEDLGFGEFRRLAGGPAFSCAQGWGPGQVLEAFWRDVFAATPQGYRVLEVGCGSADVSVWAAGQPPRPDAARSVLSFGPAARFRHAALHCPEETRAPEGCNAETDP